MTAVRLSGWTSKPGRQRRDALLWNFTVLGEAVGQVSEEAKARFPDIAWQQPQRLRNRIVLGSAGSV
jgi:uncharacterized protein with HEPN domain